MHNIAIHYDKEFVTITLQMAISDWIEMIKPKMPTMCKKCGTTDLMRHGHTDKGKQRWRCMNSDCDVFSFTED